MVTKLVIDEFTVDDSLTICDPTDFDNGVVIKNTMPGLWQVRAHEQDKGFKGKQVTLLEVVHLSKVNEYSSLSFTDPLPFYSSSTISILKDKTVVPEIDANHVICGSYGATVHAYSLEGQQLYSLSYSFKLVSCLKLFLTHYN